MPAMPLTTQTLEARARHSFRTLVRAFGNGNPYSSTIELPGGIVGCCVPGSPRLPLLNACCFDDPAALAPSLPEIARHYERAGVTAWSVWVFPGQESPELDAALVARGLSPGPPQELMGVDLGQTTAHPPSAAPSGYVVAHDGHWDELARTNERAYGHPPGEYAPTMAPGPPSARIDRVVARDERTGEVAACAFFIDDGANAVTGWVGTVPEARRLGLARAVMLAGMSAAAANGSSSVTLDATPDGVPLYESLGFERLGTIATWITGI